MIRKAAGLFGQDDADCKIPGGGIAIRREEIGALSS
jgi:hypothetical protein